MAINPPAALAAGTYTLLAAVNQARHLTLFASNPGGLRIPPASAPAPAGQRSLAPGVHAALPTAVRAELPPGWAGTLEWLRTGEPAVL